MRESAYQAHVIRELHQRLPGCVVMKNDPNYIQGIPDLTILYGVGWATLEVKISENAPERPNQGYYVDIMNEMSFSAFIYPEIEEEVLDALQQALKPRRYPRVSKRKQLPLD